MDINESADSPTRRRSLPHSTNTCDVGFAFLGKRKGVWLPQFTGGRKALLSFSPLLPYSPPPPRRKKGESLGEGPRQATPATSWEQAFRSSTRFCAHLPSLPGIQHYVKSREAHDAVLYLTCRFRSRAWKKVLTPLHPAMRPSLRRSLARADDDALRWVHHNHCERDEIVLQPAFMIQYLKRDEYSTVWLTPSLTSPRTNFGGARRKTFPYVVFRPCERHAFRLA